jgi:tRNA threonylcarbamoyladenosine biosynthesis protein TsaE
MEIFTTSPAETKKLGQKIGADLNSSKQQVVSSKGATVIGLSGNLGSGKTTFTQGFTRGIGIKQRIVSPTFILMRTYEIPKGEHKHFYHIDLYRLEGSVASQLADLGIGEILGDPENIVLVEWAERAEAILTPNKSIDFEVLSENKRKNTIR